jgi:hypothetical protein
MSETMTYTDELTIVRCLPSCGMRFAIPSDLNAKALNDRGAAGTWITCPLGHRWHYTGKSEAEKLREQLERAERRSTWLQSDLDQANAEASYQERRARSLKGVVTKTKQRIAKGACPCCSSSFPDLAAHMAEAHPEFTAAVSGVMEEDQ